MEKYSEVVGLPVICMDSGKRIGIIHDVIFCPAKKKVTAFLLERKGYQVSKTLIMIRDVVNLGRDALIINDKECLTQFRKVKDADGIRNKGNIKGLRIYSKSGQDLGVVKDILFDYKTGVIEGVEVSDGIIHDLFAGRNILPLFGKVEFSEENILVDREAVEEMMSTGGGLKKKLMDDWES